MSMNYPVGGAGGSLGPDRHVPAVEPVAKNQEMDTTGLTNAASAIPLSFTSTHELRQAELQGETVTISEEQVVKAIEHAIKAMEGHSTSLEFSIHEKTKLISVKVLDKDSGEIIREIPPEKNLDFVAKLWQMAGILVDEKR